MADLDALKKKYDAVFAHAQRRGVVVTNAHIEQGKLLIRARVPNDKVKNELWDHIKAADPAFGDLLVDFSIDATMKVPETIYEVKGGDTLSKIAKFFYGDANKYMKIFEANKDQLADPDKIKVGQKLRIPD
jgi:nucleoid-associated protein YgaU